MRDPKITPLGSEVVLIPVISPENMRLRAAMAQALEQCWEGHLPISVLEHALEPQDRPRKKG